MRENQMIKGFVIIRGINSVSQEIEWEHQQSNLIPENSLLEILGSNSVAGYFGLKQISISTSTAEPSEYNSTLTQIIGSGYIPSGVTSPTWHEGIEPPFGQIQNRINFTGADRTFNSVGLTNIGGSPDDSLQNNLETTTYAYLKLDVPCTQEATQFLDIFYRIQFDNFGGQGLTKQARYDFGKKLITGNPNSNLEFRISYLYSSPSKLPTTSDYINLYAPAVQVAYTLPLSNVGWDNQLRIESHFKWKYVLNAELEEFTGIVFSLMMQGISDSLECAYTQTKYVYNEEPFQTGFWHSNEATVPFFDPLTSGNSRGIITLSGNWTGGFPELYKITIVGAGATGVATYKFSLRKHLGFVGNSYIDTEVACPFRNPNIAAAPGQHGWRDENNDVLRYSNTQVVQYDQNGITLLDLISGNYKTWDAVSTPALGATDIRQCATDGSKIYVACRSTGLWVIDVAANSINRPLTVSCYGVDVGRNSIAYAIVNGGLYKSNNWGAALTFNFAGISDSNWARVKFIKCDPENVSDQIAIVADNGAGTNRVVWWQNSNNTATLGFEGDTVKPWTASLDVSDTGSFWVCGNNILAYGTSNTTTSISNVPSKQLTHSLYGDDNYYKVSFYKDKFITADQLVSADNTGVVSYRTVNNTSCIIHMDSGIVLTNRFMRQLLTDNAYCWSNYGWNGSAWVEGNDSAKTTHGSDAGLINGIQVKFTNGATTPHFSATNYFTQSVNYGLLKDNATELYFVSAWYSRPAQFNSSASGTIPGSPHQVVLPAATDPDFITLEVDSPELHDFRINSLPVLNVYVAGETPAPQEVTIDSNGTITFNSADAGKTFTAMSYTWVKR